LDSEFETCAAAAVAVAAPVVACAVVFDGIRRRNLGDHRNYMGGTWET
jgi:hypothetical protein